MAEQGKQGKLGELGELGEQVELVRGRLQPQVVNQDILGIMGSLNSLFAYVVAKTPWHQQSRVI